MFASAMRTLCWCEFMRTLAIDLARQLAGLQDGLVQRPNGLHLGGIPSAALVRALLPDPGAIVVREYAAEERVL